MKTLDLIREEVAQREGYDTWDSLIGAVTMAFVPVSVLDVLITDIATMYAEEALDECAKIDASLIIMSDMKWHHRVLNVKNQLK